MVKALRQIRSDGRLEILTTTKEQGSWSQYIDVGKIETDAFGQVFTRLGYAKKFPGIEVVRKYEGKGASTYCRWLIRIAPDFPYIIRQVTNAGGSDKKKAEILYQP